MPWLQSFVAATQAEVSDSDLEVLRERGVTDEQVRDFGIGVVHSKLPDMAYPKSFYSWAWEGRRVSDSVVFPLTNALGAVKGLQFRSLDKAKKGYVDFLPVKNEPVLFGLGQAMPHIWKTGSVALVEGAYDLFPVQRFEPGVVATLTARLTKRFATLLKRLASDVWFGYDRDETGREAVANAKKYYGRSFRIREIVWPDLPYGGRKAKDPGEVWEVWGEDRFGVFLRKELGHG